MMNKNRRKVVAEVIGQLQNSRDKLTQLANEERAAIDALPDGLKDSDQGQEMEGYAELLEDGAECLDSVIGDLQNI